MNLYQHQKKILKETLHLLEKRDASLIVMPTGSGKTVVFSSIAKTLNIPTLIIAHTVELIEQAKNTLKKLSVQNCTCITVQSALNRIESLSDYNLLIVDECHRAASPSYKKIINCFKGKKILGVTATPFRMDKKSIYNIFGKPHSTLSLIEMIELGFLCDFEGFRFQTNVSLKGVSTQGGDFQSSRLDSVINVKNRNNLIVNAFKEKCAEKKSLCFCVSIQHAIELCKEFQSQGFSAHCLHGKIETNERKRILKQFSSGKIQILTNCQILTEGFDEPSIECLIMARPTLSSSLYTQMIGRGSRLFPGKEVCTVLEFTDNQYDVCKLEDLTEQNVSFKKFRQGEKLSVFSQRVKKELVEEGKSTIQHAIQVFQKSYSLKLASEFQISMLKSLKIEFSQPIYEITANQLIAKAFNG